MQLFKMLDSESYQIMEFASRFIKRADPDTVGTVRAVGCPPAKTGFSVDVPFKHTFPVGNIKGFPCWSTFHD